MFATFSGILLYVLSLVKGLNPKSKIQPVMFENHTSLVFGGVCIFFMYKTYPAVIVEYHLVIAKSSFKKGDKAQHLYTVGILYDVQKDYVLCACKQEQAFKPIVRHSMKPFYKIVKIHKWHKIVLTIQNDRFNPDNFIV